MEFTLTPEQAGHFAGMIVTYEDGIQGVFRDIYAGYDPRHDRTLAKMCYRFIKNGCFLIYTEDIKSAGFKDLEEYATQFSNFIEFLYGDTING